MKKLCLIKMLSTDNKESPLGLQANGVLKFVGTHGLNGLGVGKMQHLYVLSNEQINDRDWVMSTNSDAPLHVDGELKADMLLENHWRKIVSSTDKIMTPNAYIADDFIKEYVDRYNAKDKITKVYLFGNDDFGKCNCRNVSGERSET